MYCVKVNNMKPIILRLSLRMNLNDFFLEKVNPYFLRNPFKSLENHETFYKIDLTNFSWSWINPFCSLIQFSFNSFFLHNLSKKKKLYVQLSINVTVVDCHLRRFVFRKNLISRKTY